MIKIVTDTTSGIEQTWAKQHGIPVLPQVIYFGEESYLEVEEMDLEEFLRRLKSSPVLPRTAAPPPGLFIEVFKELEADKHTILCIHPSSEVSGTVRSALVAKSESFPDADIRILDTRTIAGQLATMVKLARQWVDEGLDADIIMGRLEALVPRTRSHFLVDTLDYLQRGGRIGGAAALVGKLLQVKPILTLRDGRVEALSRERTKKRARARLEELVLAEMAADISPCLQIMHSEAPDDARELAAFFKGALGRDDIEIYDLVPAIVTHAGPGTLAVSFIAREK